MERETDLFKTFLVPVDFSPYSDEAFRVACQVSRLSGETLLVLHVIDTSALAAFNRLGLLAVPSDSAPQRRRLRRTVRQCGQDFLRQYRGKSRSHRGLSRPDRAACPIRLTTQIDALTNRWRRS